MNVALQVEGGAFPNTSWERGLVAILPIHDEATLSAINHVWPLVSSLPTRAIGTFVLLYKCRPTATRLDWQFFPDSIRPTFHLSVRP